MIDLYDPLGTRKALEKTDGLQIDEECIHTLVEELRRDRCVSCCVTVSPERRWDRMAATSLSCSGGNSMRVDCPTASAAL